MNMGVRNGLIQGARASYRGPQISHLLFTDDCIVFGKANGREVETFKTILRQYERSSGQCVNYEKSSIFFSCNTTEE